MYCVGLPPKTQTSANVEAPASSGLKRAVINGLVRQVLDCGA